MHVAIRTNALRLSQPFRQHMRQRLMSAVERLGRRVNQIHIYLSDSNGKKGGEDKSCRVVVHVRRQTPLVVEDRGTSLLPLVQSVLDRLENAVDRRVDRLMERSGRVSMSGR